MTMLDLVQIENILRRKKKKYGSTASICLGKVENFM